MDEKYGVADGLYRLVKLEEDENPIFPSHETVVEVRGGEVINLSTDRGCELSALGSARMLFGPLQGPYDITPIEKLPQVTLDSAPATVPSKPVVPADK